ncbi:MAG: hypothetical protein ACK5DJ_08215, partial [Bacteroidota bacterium]
MRFKSILSTLFTALVCCTASAQAPKCHTDEAHQQLLSSNPSMIQQLQANEISVRDWIRNNRNSQQRGTST